MYVLGADGPVPAVLYGLSKRESSVSHADFTWVGRPGIPTAAKEYSALNI